MSKRGGRQYNRGRGGWYWDRERDEEGQGEREGGIRRGGGLSRGLFGNEIGLFYARKRQIKKQDKGQDKAQDKARDKEKNERPIVCIDRSSEQNIVQILQEVKEGDGEERGATKQDTGAENMEILSTPILHSPIVTPTMTTPTNEILLQEQVERESNPDYQKMLEFRKSLPSWTMKKEIMDAIESNQVIVISGKTGCGKTTQIAQYILDDAIQNGRGSQCHVICTQPRRISAITVAQRVAAERAELLGVSVGYQIRLESTLPRPFGSILYCTTGIMVRRLITDPILSQCSHLILDEVHERNNVSDFLAIIVKDILPKRPDLKLILMSATINADLFSKYFNNAPIISIPGRTFPVQEYYLEDVLKITKFAPGCGRESEPHPHWSRYGHTLEQVEYFTRLESDESYPASVVDALCEMDLEKINLSLFVSLIKHISLNEPEGAILVFLPGLNTISKLNDMLMSEVMFRNSSKFVIIPLHSLMPTASQKEVFERPPHGVRKIVIATNIAETSITIDDVVYVIDCGKVKETTYDVNNQLACLNSVWESKAAATQRRGRAGRVQPGQCYHMFTRHQFSKMAEFQLPEMLRTPLEELILQIKILKLGQAQTFLKKALEPPPAKSVSNAVQLLKDLRALSPQEELTPMGYHLANLPVHPRIGRMILFGAIMSCLDPVLTIASTLGFKEPFVIPLDKQEDAVRVKKELSRNSESDHVTLLNAFDGWERACRHGNAEEYCLDYFLSSNTLEMLLHMKKQFAGLLYDIGFVPSAESKNPSVNYNSNNLKLVKAVLCAGLYPNVAKITPGKRTAKLYTQQDGKVKFHPKSVNSKQGEFQSRFLIYHTKVKSSAIFLHDSSVIPPFPLLFFGGEISTGRDGEQETIAVDDWIVFQAPVHIADLVKNMRRQLNIVLEEKIANPRMVLYNPNSTTPSSSQATPTLSQATPSSRLIQAIIDLITSEDYSEQQARIAQGRHLYPRKYNPIHFSVR